jgi:hypothetical protein
MLVLTAAGRAQSALTLETIEGDGAIYNLRGKQLSRPRVRVSAPDGRPVEGAAVTFRLPDSGAGATFAEGRISTIVTGVNGEAVVPAMRLNGQLGPWEIRVVAARAGVVARSSIQQINAAPAEAITAGNGNSSRKKYWIAAAAAGAATLVTLGLAGGTATARLGGVSAPAGPAAASPASQALTISAGAGSVGAP